ncbi:MAG: hypothetical protein HQM10_15155 [Candidatus Riflebacteria bacterium]|nr:hypothetical protein [Candidatus Riflebacteria bacterium]
MVYPEMLGVTELFQDDLFLGWMEDQPDTRIQSLSTFEIFHIFQRELSDNQPVNLSSH